MGDFFGKQRSTNGKSLRSARDTLVYLWRQGFRKKCVNSYTAGRNIKRGASCMRLRFGSNVIVKCAWCTLIIDAAFGAVDVSKVHNDYSNGVPHPRYNSRSSAGVG